VSLVSLFNFNELADHQLKGLMNARESLTGTLRKNKIYRNELVAVRDFKLALGE
jgi:hypothetical protein